MQAAHRMASSHMLPALACRQHMSRCQRTGSRHSHLQLLFSPGRTDRVALMHGDVTIQREQGTVQAEPGRSSAHILLPKDSQQHMRR